MKKISIIMATYNRADLLPRAIESVFNQTYANWELLIVDDGSTDDTKEKAEQLMVKDKRIKYFFQKNKGPSAAWNFGLREAGGEYVTIVDSDDEYFPERIEKMLNFMEKNPSLDFCGSYVEACQNNKSAIYTFPENGFENNFRIYLEKCGLLALSGMNVMMKKSFSQKVGLFDERMKNWEDIDYFIRAFTIGNFGFLREPLLKYHIHENNISGHQNADDYAVFYKNNFALFKKYDLTYHLDKNLGAAYLRSGNKKEGRKWLCRALGQNPTLPDFFKIIFHFLMSYAPTDAYLSMLRKFDNARRAL